MIFLAHYSTFVAASGAHRSSRNRPLGPKMVPKWSRNGLRRLRLGLRFLMTFFASISVQNNLASLIAGGGGHGGMRGGCLMESIESCY